MTSATRLSHCATVFLCILKIFTNSTELMQQQLIQETIRVSLCMLHVFISITCQRDILKEKSCCCLKFLSVSRGMAGSRGCINVGRYLVMFLQNWRNLIIDEYRGQRGQGKLVTGQTCGRGRSGEEEYALISSDSTIIQCPFSNGAACCYSLLINQQWVPLAG